LISQNENWNVEPLCSSLEIGASHEIGIN